MEQQPLIKNEPDEFSNIESIDQLPSYNLLDESDDLYEDKSWAVKSEHEVQADADHHMDIKIEDSSIQDIVPCKKTETLSSKLKEDVEEENQERTSCGSGSHLNESETTLSRDTFGASLYQCDIMKEPFCGTCGAKFNQIGHLKAHTSIHSELKQNYCAICGKNFTGKSTLNQHLAIHNGLRPHTCSICEVKFLYKSSLIQHMLIHSAIKPHLCDICGKNFTLECNLKAHMLIHSRIKAHSCSICKTNFALKSNMKRHMLIHNGLKPHSCSICEAIFTRKYILKKHMLTHSGL